MSDSKVKTFEYNNGEIQRVICVTESSFDKLCFVKPAPSEKSFERICTLYKSFIVPRAPMVFGRLVLFTLPKGIELSPMNGAEYGRINDPLLCAAAILRDGLKVDKEGNVSFLSGEARTLYKSLSEKKCIDIAMGKLPFTKILPVSSEFGLLSESNMEAKIKVNSNFFIMDCFDVNSPYDVIGTPVGLCVKDGHVSNPPLFERDSLMVYYDKIVKVLKPSVRDLSVVIKGVEYFHGKDGVLFLSRPETARTKAINGVDYVIVGERVVAVKPGGKTLVPSAGFVISVPGCKDMIDNEYTGEVCINPGDEVIYKGLESVSFGIQVGNSIIRDSVKTLRFTSRFYNIKHFLWTNAYPPSLYPLDYEKDRAPRIALGADKDGKPMILWAEGKGKFSYAPGRDSCGASLLEMTDICENFGMVNAVNLDGGGSAQILLENKRSLMISDRNPDDNSEAERAVPLGIMVK